MTKAIDLTGMRFGRLTVVARAQAQSMWQCRCGCGKSVIVRRDSITGGNTKSCGCLQKETIAKLRRTHGFTVGGRNTLIIAWDNMMARCYRKNHPSFDRYGGRGIGVCTTWHKYANFHRWAVKNGHADGLSLDREKNNKGYSPANCRWASKLVQQNNRANTRFITYRGKTKPISEFARDFSIYPQLITARIKLGWSIKKILTTPPNRGTKNATAACKDCHRERDARRYKKEKEKRAALHVAYMQTRHGKLAHKRATTKWNTKNGIKRAAHIAVGNALHDGRLTRMPCEACGNKKSQAHHDDYSKPLEVRWLCVKHHSEIHHKEAA